MRTSGGVNFFGLFFVFPVDFQLFSELAVKQAISGVAKVFAVYTETVKKEGFYVSYHVCSVSVSFDSFASK